MAVDPIHVTLSKDGKLRSVSGRTIVMERRGGRPAPIDAELVVESEAPIGCVAAAAGSPSTPDRL
jgi:hypothetical protein